MLQIGVTNLVLIIPLLWWYSSVEGISSKGISDMGGLHQMLGLREHIFVANPRDSIMSLPEHQSTNKMGASFETPYGRLLVKNTITFFTKCFSSYYRTWKW